MSGFRTPVIPRRSRPSASGERRLRNDNGYYNRNSSSNRNYNGDGNSLITENCLEEKEGTEDGQEGERG